MTDLINKRSKFEQLSRKIPIGESAKKFTRYTCPCCGYPTLVSRAHYDICQLCDWEDDGQDEDNLAEFNGGPNGCYSLAQARENFSQYHTMYSPDNNTSLSGGDSAERLRLKRELISVFEQLLQAQGNENITFWQQAIKIERQLHNELKRSIKQYEKSLK